SCYFLLYLFLFASVLICGTFNHFLYYIYTGLSKDLNLKGVYEFTALGLLDDREIDYYNSKEQKKIPKQSWMMEKMQEDYWEKGTQSRKSKEQFCTVIVNLFGLNLRSSCSSVENWLGISEYSYDGSDFLSFDYENMRWIAAVPQAEPTKRKWDNETICVDWLIKFMEYGKETLRKHSPPAVYGFAKKSVSDSKKVSLTCLATGFYPKDVDLSVRKFGTSIPDHLITTSGVRPNEDGTYQLRKSAEISDDPTDYDCNVHHSTIEEPAIKKWANPKTGSGLVLIGGVAVGVIVILLIVLAVLFFVLRTRRRNGEYKCFKGERRKS
uniref:Ig-like domain-containing protein n=1 Tax=Astyanax mexicanus TaxID=7994 RepID=A0A3B1IDX7_ASTMX